MRTKHKPYKTIELRDELARQGKNVFGREGIRALAELMVEEVGPGAQSADTSIDSWLLQNWPPPPKSRIGVHNEPASNGATPPLDAQAGDGAGDTDAVAADASRDYLPDEEPAPDTGDAGYDESAASSGQHAGSDAPGTIIGFVTRTVYSEPPSKADTARLEAPPRRATAFSITAFRKDGGPLTKRITLADDGKVKSDGSDCLMTRGTARAVHFTSLAQIGEFIGALQGDEAIALGTLRGGLPEEVRVTTKRRLNGSAGVIARTGDNIPYREGKPALALIDYDIKGMPPAVAERMTAAGGLAGSAVGAA